MSESTTTSISPRPHAQSIHYPPERPASLTGNNTDTGRHELEDTNYCCGNPRSACPKKSASEDFTFLFLLSVPSQVFSCEGPLLVSVFLPIFFVVFPPHILSFLLLFFFNLTRRYPINLCVSLSTFSDPSIRFRKILIIRFTNR